MCWLLEAPWQAGAWSQQQSQEVWQRGMPSPTRGKNNLKKFNNRKYEVLNTGRNNLMHQQKSGATRLARSSAEKDLGVLIDKLIMCALAAKKATSISACTMKGVSNRSRDMTLLLCSALVRYIWSAVPGFVLPNASRTWAYCRMSSKKPQRELVRVP